MFQDCVLNMGLEIIKSAVALLQAVGILYRTARAGSSYVPNLGEPFVALFLYEGSDKAESPSA